ncbi:hypothetical protein D3C72_812080 [compost metagenome]
MKTALMALVLFVSAVSQASVQINANNRQDGNVKFEVMTLTKKGVWLRTEYNGNKVFANNFQFDNDVIKAAGLSKKELMDLIKDNTNSKDYVLTIDVTMGETNEVKSIDYVKFEKVGLENY